MGGQLLEPDIPTQAAQSRDRISLRCVRCKSDLNGLNCARCGLRIHEENGIVYALAPERTAHFARFVEDYERIRRAEGRGGKNPEYYLHLPYEHVSGDNKVKWHIRARSYECLIRSVLAGVRNGAILDLGAGNCWLSYRLSLLGHRPVAVDLLTNDDDGLGAAAHYQAALSESFPRFQAEFTSLPFQSGQFDVVIYNASFHYSENYEANLREALRCLRDGGIVVISDTAWYSCEESGRKMVSERQTAFRQRYGTASDSIQSLEFVTDERLRLLEEQLSIRWTAYSPRYGLKWALRPWIARLRGSREPSKFRIYAARKNA